MKRFVISAIGLLMVIAFAAAALTTENASYAMNVKATQTGGQIKISIRITAPTGSDAKAGTVYAPTLIIADGMRASGTTVDMPEAKASASKSADAAASPQNIELKGTGVQFDVIKAKGTDEVLVVATALQKGVVVWAEARTVKVEVATPGTANPGNSQTPG